MIGEHIGNYRVVALVGSGGMGHVYEARTSIDTRVAIKVLRPEVSQNEEHVQRLFNEARAVHRIRHAGAARIFDVGKHDGHAYLVMEFLEGERLADRIAREGRIAGAAVFEIGRQIASVLEAVHDSGVIHRDLKPDNIYLVHDQELSHGERVKVLDFGIAKVSASASGRTVGAMGTPAYMAPEQWNNSADVDAAADVYSFGCVMFELACGRPPFEAQTMAEACSQHLHAVPPRARSIAPGLPAALDDLLAQMLAKAPRDRPTVRRCARVFAELRASSGQIRAVGEPQLASELASIQRPAHRVQTTFGGGELIAAEPRSSWGQSAMFIVGGVAFGVAALAVWVLVAG